MGNEKYESAVKKIEITDSNKVKEPLIKKTADVQLPNLKKKKGIIIISDNPFFKRLWFLLSNPFRYIFTGKVRY